MLHPRIHYGLPVLFFAVYLVVCKLSGFSMHIPWHYYHLLDRCALTDHPLESLLLLHSQPPLMNGMLAAMICCSDLFGISLEATANTISTLVGLTGTILLYDIVFVLLRSKAMALVAVLLSLSEPGFPLFSHVFFYEFPSHFLHIVLISLSIRYFRGGKRKLIYLIVFLLASASLLRVLYGPPWAIAVFLLIIFLRHRICAVDNPRQRPVHLAPFLLLILLLAIWPAKNYLVFKKPIYSSWIGYNLSKGTPVKDARLVQYLDTGTVPITLKEQAHIPKWIHDPSDNVLTSPSKSNHARNWNHFVFLLVTDDLASRALSYRFTHLGRWLDHAKSYYLRWGRATYIDPNTSETFLVPMHISNAYIWFAQLYRHILHFDLRPVLTGMSRGPVVAQRVDADSPTPWPIFSVIFLPAVVIVSIVYLKRRRKNHSWKYACFLLLFFLLLWPMVVVCYTDGSEGNRMRFSTNAVLIILILYNVKNLRISLRAKRRRRRGEERSLLTRTCEHKSIQNPGHIAKCAVSPGPSPLQA